VRQHLQDGFDVVVEVGVERGRRRNWRAGGIADASVAENQILEPGGGSIFVDFGHKIL
jgi:hypothetical protein